MIIKKKSKQFSLKNFYLVVMFIFGLLISFNPIQSVNAINGTCSQTNGLCATCYSNNTSNCTQSSTTPNTCTTSSCNLISNYVNPTINLLSGIIGLVVIGSIILAGIQYTSSEGDPQKVAKAKSRITNSIIAFLFFILLYSFIQFIIPGGLLN